MTLLSGFSYKKVVKKIRQFGFVFDRQAAGSHEIWWNPVSRQRTTIPNHPGDIPAGTLKAILKQADIDVKDFLK